MPGKWVAVMVFGAVVGGVLRREVVFGRKRRELVALRAKYAGPAEVRAAMGGPGLDAGTLRLLGDVF